MRTFKNKQTSIQDTHTYRNEIWTTVKGHTSVTNMRKMTGNNTSLDLVNSNAYTKFDEILSILSEDIERNRNSVINQGP